MSIKIAFVCDWGETSSSLLNKYRKQTPKTSGIWGNIVGVQDIERADVIVVLGNYTKKFPNNIEKSKKIIQLRREPDFIESFIPITNNYYDYKNFYHVSTWQFVSKSFDKFKLLKPSKRKHVSAITSNKWQHRNEYFDVINSTQREIEIFGKLYKRLHPLYKDKALAKYRFSIAIENSSQKNYFTEKINDCFLFSTLPLYWGCPNISHFFPKDSYRLIDINKPEEIKHIISEPITKKTERAIEEAKNLILYKYNIWPSIESLIRN
jgi:hypothetical protein